MRKDGFGKNKKTKEDKNCPAEESTHYSEAEDMVVYGIVESGLTIPEETGGGLSYSFMG